jgi:hypothetical protein
VKPWRACAWLASATLVAAAVACGSFKGEDGGANDGDGAAETSTSGDAHGDLDASASSEGGTTGPTDAGLAVDSGPPVPGRTAIYAQTFDNLYRFDPASGQLDVVGALSSSNGISDLAIDSSGNVFAISAGGLYRLDPNDAAATTIGGSGEPFTLAFVAPSFLDSGSEAMLAHQGNDIVQIDPSTGAVADIKPDAMSPYIPLGDVVGTPDGRVFATVYDNSANSVCFTGDACLVELARGTAIPKNTWVLGVSNIVALAYWKDTFYGFSSDGFVVAMSLTSDGGISTVNITPDGGGVNWRGAASTLAPQ